VPVTVGHNPLVPAFFFFSFTPNPSPKKPKNLKPNTLFFFFSKNSCINPGQPAGKGREKKLKKKKNPVRRRRQFRVEKKKTKPYPSTTAV
jgi:hypothetical protein